MVNRIVQCLPNDTCNDEGVLGKLAHIVKLIVDRADPSLYDRDVDFHDTELALILDDKKIGNHLKAEMLVGIRM